MSDGVLLVGPESRHQERLGALLDELGVFRTSTISDAGVLARSFDLAVVDIASDEEAGVDSLKALRATGARTPVYILTSELKTALFTRLVPLGVECFLLTSEGDDEWRKKLARAVDADADRTPARRPAKTTSDTRPPRARGRSRLAIPTRALIVARPTELRERVSGALRDRGFAVHAADSGSDNPFGRVVEDERITLVVAEIDTLEATDFERFHDLVCATPGLTSIAVHRDSGSERTIKLSAAGVDVALPTWGQPGELADLAVDRTSDHDLDETAVTALQLALPAALAETRFELEPMPASLRVSPRLPAELAAFISIEGDLVARVGVAAAPRFFERLARDWLGVRAHNRGQIWDAAGELANRVAGQIRNQYMAAGLESSQSAPTVIEGSAVSVSSTTTRPTLVAPFSCARLTTPIFVELQITAKRSPSADAETEFLEQGELTFL